MGRDSKKALGPVVATSLLIVVSVVAIVGFQNWFNTYQANLNSDVEKNSNINDLTQILDIVGNVLYIDVGSKNITLKKIKINGNECDVETQNLDNGIQQIDLKSCLDGYNNQEVSVAVISDESVLSKKIFSDDIKYKGIAINNCFELQNITLDLDEKYYLANDIDCSDTINWNGGLGFMPIGVYASDPFTGILDGDGHIISDLFINDTSSSSSGLFAYADDAIFKNLGFIDVNITGGGYRIGALIGYMHTSIIDNVYSTGFINGSRQAAGIAGVARYNSVISDSYSEVDINGYGILGGLVGALNTDSEIHRSYAKGNVVGDNQYCGGLIGDLSEAFVYESYASGNVSCVVSKAGGLIGNVAGASIINNTYALGNADSDNQVGGLLGLIEGTSLLHNSYSIGTATGANSGGLVGYLGGSAVVEYSYYDSTTSGKSDNSGKGIPKITSEMQNITTFESEWNFPGTWTISLNEYPQLAWS